LEHGLRLWNCDGWSKIWWG